jgi:glycosyltransferase involved in cell wall biosynthesis
MKCRAQLGVSEGERLIGLVARLHPVKDHKTFILAALELHRKASRLRFAVIGPGVEKIESVCPTLKPAIRELGPALILADEMNDVAAVMNALDVCVLTSIAEGFPNVIGEAMACGVPCVVTDVGDCREIVGDTGVTVPVGSPSAVANAVLSVLSSDSDARRVEARLRVRSRYSIDDVVNRYECAWSDAANKVDSHHVTSAGA